VHVKQWHYHKEEEPLFYRQPWEKTNRHFGFELEVIGGLGNVRSGEMTEMIAQTDNYGRFYFEEDGSIRRECPNSFELISQPFTFGYFQCEIKPLLRQTLKLLRACGWESEKTRMCGLHFHVSRDSLSLDAIVKLLLLSERFRSELFNLSGRTDICTYDEYARSHMLTLRRIFREANNSEEKVNAVSVLVRNRELRERHTALNVSNESTVEFRIFKGTLDLNTFCGCLDLFRYMIDIAENITAYRLYRMKWKQFVNNAKGFSPELDMLIEKRLPNIEEYITEQSPRIRYNPIFGEFAGSAPNQAQSGGCGGLCSAPGPGELTASTMTERIYGRSYPLTPPRQDFDRPNPYRGLLRQAPLSPAPRSIDEPIQPPSLQDLGAIDELIRISGERARTWLNDDMSPTVIPTSEIDTESTYATTSTEYHTRYVYAPYECIPLFPDESPDGE